MLQLISRAFRLSGTIFLALFIVLTAFGGLALAAGFLPGQEIVAKVDTQAYESLDDAKKGAEGAWEIYPPQVLVSQRNVNEVFTVREDMGDWLRVGQGESGDTWVKAADMILLEAFMADPANREIIECSPGLPRLFVVNLAPDLKRAVIRITTVPTIEGGHGVLEVLTPDESKVLWRSKEEGEEYPDLRLDCAPNAINWPEIIGDIDGDGFAELLYMELPVRPPDGLCTIYKWDGKAFVKAASPVLAVKGLEMPSSATIGTISDYPDQDEPYFYVTFFKSLDADGTITANFLLAAPTSKTGTGKFTLTDDYKTFTFKGWVSPPMTRQERENLP